MRAIGRRLVDLLVTRLDLLFFYDLTRLKLIRNRPEISRDLPL